VGGVIPPSYFMKYLSFFFILLGVFTFVSKSQAAIEFDNSELKQGTESGNPASITWSHVITGANNILVVSGYYTGSGSGCTNWTGITYNGDALTKLSYVDMQAGACAIVWYLVNPDTGTHDLVATESSASNTYYSFVSASYSGVLQDVIDIYDTSTGGSGAKTNTLTPDSDGTIALSGGAAASTYSLTTNLTLVAGDIFTESFLAVNTAEMENGVESSFTMTPTSGDNGGMISFILNPSAVEQVVLTFPTDGLTLPTGQWDVEGNCIYDELIDPLFPRIHVISWDSPYVLCPPSIPTASINAHCQEDNTFSLQADGQYLT